MQVSGSEEAEIVVNSGPNFKRIMNAIGENPHKPTGDVIRDTYFAY